MSYSKRDVATNQIKTCYIVIENILKRENQLFCNSCDICGKMNSLYSDMSASMRTHRLKIKQKDISMTWNVIEQYMHDCY